MKFLKNHHRILNLTGCVMLCLCICAAALGDTSVEMADDEWTWESAGTATFHGTIYPDRDVTGAELELSVETQLENSGEAVFTSLNEKRIKIRKQLPVTTTDLTGGEAVPFEAEWRLPEDVGNGLAWARIRILVKDDAGHEIGSGVLENGSVEAQQAQTNSAPTRIADRVILWALIAAALSWALAVTRYVLIRSKAKKGT